MRSQGVMSSDVIARVMAFYQKARELDEKGHLLRASENYARADEAARALDPGPDNVVALNMQRWKASVLRNHAYAVGETDAVAVDPRHRADCISLLSSVVAALERRRVAGTLLAGKCTLAEEAWHAVEVRAFPAASVTWRAQLVGYDIFLQTAMSVLGVLVNAWFFASECSATQFECFVQHVAHAADMFMLPRSHGTEWSGAELNFTDRYDTFMAVHLGRTPLDARLVQLLTTKWQRLQQSGVMGTRGLLNEQLRLMKRTSQLNDVAAVDAAMSAPGLRSCALAGCAAKEAHPQHFKSCSACRTVVYCCREHQVEGWPHRTAAARDPPAPHREHRMALQLPLLRTAPAHRRPCDRLARQLARSAKERSLPPLVSALTAACDACGEAHGRAAAAAAARRGRRRGSASRQGRGCHRRWRTRRR